MTVRRIVARRAAFGLVTAWAVLSGVFLLFTATGDWVLRGRIGALRWGGADEAAVESFREQYLAQRGLDRPLWAQYLDWMGEMFTLDWGVSRQTGEAAFPLVTGAVARTAAYVLPAVALAVIAGTVIGFYAASRPDSRVASTGSGAGYLLFALPNFWIGGLLVSLVVGEAVGYSPLLFEHLLPIGLTATTLLGGYVSYSRAHALEHASADFVKLVAAKGAGPRRMAVHVARNAAIPLCSMLFTEALGLLVLSVFVIEALFGIEGFGLLMFEAVRARDLPVVLGGTMVVVAVGVLGNVLQDLSYHLLDPRVDTGRR